MRFTRRFFENFLIFLMLLASPVQAVEADKIRVVIYGDSLTSGYKLSPEESYSAQIDKKLRDMGYVNIETISMSRPGETTSGGSERLSSLIVKQPDIVVLELGANDVLRRVDARVIHSNLANIISQLRQKNVYVVLIGMQAPPNMGPSYAQQVKAVYKSLADYYRLAFYPFVLDGIYGKPELNLADGYHPNGKGIELMVDNTLRLVDAGVRWKYEILRQRQEYENGLEEGTTTTTP